MITCTYDDSRIDGRALRARMLDELRNDPHLSRLEVEVAVGAECSVEGEDEDTRARVSAIWTALLIEQRRRDHHAEKPVARRGRPLSDDPRIHRVLLTLTHDEYHELERERVRECTVAPVTLPVYVRARALRGLR